VQVPGRRARVRDRVRDSKVRVRTKAGGEDESLELNLGT
jgi:hypothetical protein